MIFTIVCQQAGKSKYILGTFLSKNAHFTLMSELKAIILVYLDNRAILFPEDIRWLRHYGIDTHHVQ